MTLSEVVPYAIPFLTPLIVLGVKKYFHRVPKQVYPIIAAMAGPALDFIAAYTTNGDTSPLNAFLLGLAGVGVREVKEQIASLLKKTS